MLEVLGDIREHPDPSVALAQESLATLGYVITSDSDSTGLEPRFRAEVLPEYANYLREDIYGVPPAGRLRADGLVDYVLGADGGSPRLTRDYAHVAIPHWSGDGSAKSRVYTDGLPILAYPAARRWLRGVITLALPELLEPEGSISVHYFETGRGDGRVVEGMHQDGERLVGSFPDHINGKGAVSTLARPIAWPEGSEVPILEEVATFRLGLGDVALSSDTKLWHGVSRLTPPPDGSEPRRRAFIFAFHTPQTHQWLQDAYASGRIPADPASR